MLPISPWMLVGRGRYEAPAYGADKWELRAQLVTVDGREGVCFRFTFVGYTDDAGGGCTFPPDLKQDAGLLGWGGNLDFPLVLYGFAPLETARVRVAHGGEVSEGLLFRAPEELGGDFNFVVGFAPSLEVDVVTTGFDAAGNEIWKDVKKATKED